MDSDVASSSSRASSPELEEAGSPELRPSRGFCREPGRGEPSPSGGKAQPESGEQQQRLKVNSRERRRMQDLNQALDGLREVMPYARGPAVRKLSKLATLLLARSHILTLSSSLQEMRRLLSELHAGPRGHPLRLTHPAAGAQSLPPSPAACPVAAAAGYRGFRPALQETPRTAARPLGPVYRPYSGLPCLCALCQPAPATAASPSCLRASK